MNMTKSELSVWEEKGVYYCYVSSRHQLGAACQTKRPISLATW